jgi:hypothetical protein
MILSPSGAESCPKCVTLAIVVSGVRFMIEKLGSRGIFLIFFQKNLACFDLN